MKDHDTFNSEIARMIRETSKRLEGERRTKLLKTNDLWNQIHDLPDTYYRTWAVQHKTDMKILIALGNNQLVEWKTVN